MRVYCLLFNIMGVETFCVSGYTSSNTRRIVITFEQYTTILLSHDREKYFVSQASRFREKGVGISKIPPDVKFLFDVRFRSYSSG
jgi:hypothetical protein